jgi:acyl carrier protein
MEIRTKLELLADLFEVEVEEIDPQMELENFEAWDSMSKLSLIVLMDDECGKKLTGEQIRCFKTLGDIIDFMD